LFSLFLHFIFVFHAFLTLLLLRENVMGLTTSAEGALPVVAANA